MSQYFHECGCEVFTGGGGNFGGAPSHIVVGPHQNAAGVAHLAGARPIPEVIFIIAAWTDDPNLYGNAQLLANGLRSLAPRLTTNDRQYREVTFARNIKPGMRQRSAQLTPRMPGIQDLSKLGPVRVLKSYCTRPTGLTQGLDDRHHPNSQTTSLRTSNGSSALRHRALRPSPLHQRPRRAIMRPRLYQ